VHAEEEVEPVLGLYVPAEHGVHAEEEVDPVLGLKVPAGHCVQVVSVADEYVPAAQSVQELDDVAPKVVEIDPAGQ